MEIVRTLEFDRFGDDEAYRIGKQLENVIRDHRPPELAELRFNTGRDSAGDPAIWIWAILTDEAGEDKVFAKHAASIRQLLEDVERRIVPDRWPFVRFSTVGEEQDLQRARAS